jgi:hypothetical protein
MYVSILRSMGEGPILVSQLGSDGEAPMSASVLPSFAFQFRDVSGHRGRSPPILAGI